MKVSGGAGTFTITVDGVTTAAMPYNETLANVQTAVGALSSVCAGNVIVAGTAGATYGLTFFAAVPVTDFLPGEWQQLSITTGEGA